MGAYIGGEDKPRYWESGVEKILVSELEVNLKIKEFARAIEKEYEGEGIVLVGVLKGGFIFLSDLSKELNMPHSIDFIKVSSYTGTSQAKIKQFQFDITEDIKGKHVIIVEDCIDSGNTLTFIKEEFEKRDCASVKIMCLIDKDVQRGEGVIVPDWVGFKVPDVWIVGYGLDLGGLYRTIPCIAEVDPKKYSQ